MKAMIEIIKLDVANVVTASPCGGEYTPIIETPCQLPGIDDMF